MRVITISLGLLAQLVTSFQPRYGGIRSSLVLRESADEKVQALRDAAAKAKADAERIRQEIGDNSPSLTTKEAEKPAKSVEEVKAMLPNLLAESDLNKQTSMWQELKESNSVTKFASANLRSFPVTLSMLEQRAGLTPKTLGMDDSEVNLDDFKYATLYVTGGCTLVGVASLAFLPPNVGATVCYLVALIPILFLAIGSTAPVIIANAIASLKGEKPEEITQDRICRHEAAHFCCGYWCGLPIAGYSTDQNVARVEFAAANSQYSQTEVAALAVTAMSGLVAEAGAFDGVVPGTGSADLMTLDQVFRQSKDFIGAAQQQDLTRWGALTAYLLLRENSNAYEKVAKAFARQAPLEECISLLEGKNT